MKNTETNNSYIVTIKKQKTLLERSFKISDCHSTIKDGIQYYEYERVIVWITKEDGSERYYQIQRANPNIKSVTNKSYICCESKDKFDVEYRFDGKRRYTDYNDEKSFETAINRIQKQLENKI